MGRIRIRNAQLLLGGEFVSGGLLIEDGRIREVITQEADADEMRFNPADEVVDAGGDYCFPGMIDLHFHGCMGADVCDGTMEAIRKIADAEAQVGVTVICPATMTLPVSELEKVLVCLAAFHRRQEAGEEAGARLVGVNMEGPFISPVKRGAQDPQHILPADTDVFDRLWRASEGLIALMGLAPEETERQVMEHFVRHVTKAGSRVSLCHTNADYEAAAAAIRAGACHAVHLHDAMPPMTHREPGVIGAVFDDPGVTAELICDGEHIHPTVIRATFALLGAERIILISDTMRAAGMPDGHYTLGGLPVIKKGRRAELEEGSVALAGSVTMLPDMVRTAVRRMGIPLETALRCATENPARRLSIDDRFGYLKEGCQADLVFWNRDLTTTAVMQKGQWISRAEG